MIMKKIKKKRLKRQVKIILLIFFVIPFLTFLIISLIKNFDVKKTVDYNIMSYNEKSNVDYKVYLKPNNYFTEQFLPSNNQYITDIIDYIDVTFDYNYDSSKVIDYNYKYSIMGYLNVEQKDNKTSVWSKEYKLMPEVKVEHVNGNNLNINKNLKINYSEYNNYVTEFKKDYILAINASLNVVMHVEINGILKENNQTFSEEKDLCLLIPLSEQTINIKPTFDALYQNNIIHTEEIINKVNYYNVVEISLVLIIVLIIFIYLIIGILKDNKNGQKYKIERDKILNNHDDIIVTSLTEPNLDKLNVIVVASFTELLDAEQELRIPITYHEYIKNTEAHFIIINNNEAWIYILKDDEE